jgi:acyl-coenzyme A thioesterase PaaI-like protein
MSADDHLKTFESIKWATPFLTSPDWCVRPRTRGAPSDADSDPDRFVRDTMKSNDGMQHWVEMYQKPTPGSKVVPQSISLCKYGAGLMGFTAICHGGAVLTMMDEALGFAMIANEAEAAGVDTTKWGCSDGERVGAMLAAGRPLGEALKGFLLTAHLDVKFLKPVFCPGIVGIEVTVVEYKGHKMRFSGVMKDGTGMPLMKAEGLWVRIGGRAKI